MHLPLVLVTMASVAIAIPPKNHGHKIRRYYDFYDGGIPAYTLTGSASGSTGLSNPYGPYMGTKPVATNPTGTNPGGPCSLGSATGCLPSSTSGPYSNSTAALPSLPTVSGGPIQESVPGSGLSSSVLASSDGAAPSIGVSPTTAGGGEGPYNPSTGSGPQSCGPAVTMTVSTTYMVTVTANPSGNGGAAPSTLPGSGGGPVSSAGYPNSPISASSYNPPYPVSNNGTNSMGTASGSGTGMVSGTVMGTAVPSLGAGYKYT